MFESIRFLLGEATAAARKDQLSLQYQRRKTANALVVGGFGKQVAKHLSERLLGTLNPTAEVVVMNPGDEAFDAARIMVFNDEHDAGHAMILKFEVG